MLKLILLILLVCSSIVFGTLGFISLFITVQSNKKEKESESKAKTE